MSKKQVLKIIYVIMTLALCSCSTQKTRDEILKEAGQYTDNISLDTAYDYQKNIGEWLGTETSYAYDENGDTSDGIINLYMSSYILNKDRMYFQIGKLTSTSSGANLWAYLSVKTGEKHYLCPDPLCDHSKNSGCQYLNFEILTFNPDSDSTLYTVRSVYSENKSCSVIYKIDLNNNKFSEIYKEDLTDSEASSNRFDLLFIIENTLYFTDTYVYKEENGEGEIIFTEKVYLKSLNLSETTVRGNAKVLNSDYSGNKKCLYVVNNQIFGIDYGVNFEGGCFFVTDMNFENEKTILEYDNDSQIYSIFYDQNIEEFYLLVSSDAMHNSSNVEKEKGLLYCIDREFRCEEISMPSDQILEFQLTNEYIYYTIYDPVVYGMSPRGISTVDETGNKIYRVRRDNTSDAELVFDGQGELFFFDSFFVGDYLYINYKTLVRQDGLVWFKLLGSSARINVNDGTIKWINVD